jgi:hypothetical protein
METLNRYFRDLTKAAFARHGFAQTDLFARWAEIVGLERAQMCKPERIRWPRGEGEDGQKQGGTLIVQAAPGRGLDIQHETPHIVERINIYFGYGAIASIKVMQTGWRQAENTPEPKQPLPAEAAEALDRRLADIPDEALRGALKRLGSAALTPPVSQQRTNS